MGTASAPPPTPVHVAAPPRDSARLVAALAENQRLTLRVQDLEQQLWARKAERGVAAPIVGLLSLFAEPAETPDDATPHSESAAPPGTASAAGTTGTRPRTAPQARGPQPLDPALPRELITLPDPPAAARVCPEMQAPLVPGFTEQLEVLARRPAVYFVKRYVRTVWVSPAKTAPMTTPWPADVLPRARMHASVVAHIAAAHFSEHVPYYRLEQQLARTGVALARSTQVSLMAQLDGLVAPLVTHLKTLVLGSGYVATLWAYRARSPDPAVEGLVWFDYQATKSPAHPRALLQAVQYRGVVQTDGAAGLDSLGLPEHITRLGCWAHARRYVDEAVRLGDPRATGYLRQIDRLFRLDARARRITTAHPRHAARVATWRARFSEPLGRALFARSATDVLTLPPRSALAVA